MDPAAERKFISLKRRLDALHYQQPLSKSIISSFVLKMLLWYSNR